MSTNGTLELEKKVCLGGKVAELTRARKAHKCSVCLEVIARGSRYYAITIGGGGLGSAKFPDRAHPECLEKYFEPELSPDAEHDICPECGLSKQEMAVGETRICPICGEKWTRSTSSFDFAQDKSGQARK